MRERERRRGRQRLGYAAFGGERFEDTWRLLLARSYSKPPRFFEGEKLTVSYIASRSQFSKPKRREERKDEEEGERRSCGRSLIKDFSRRERSFFSRSLYCTTCVLPAYRARHATERNKREEWKSGSKKPVRLFLSPSFSSSISNAPAHTSSTSNVLTRLQGGLEPSHVHRKSPSCCLAFFPLFSTACFCMHASPFAALTHHAMSPARMSVRQSSTIR